MTITTTFKNGLKASFTSKVRDQQFVYVLFEQKSMNNG